MVVHRTPQLKPVPHAVRLDPASRLADLLDGTELVVQSVHHQAVGRLGDGLRAVAWSEDGVIEAVESERHPFVIGVQWHPELDALSDPRPMRLFEALVAARRDVPALHVRLTTPSAPAPLRGERDRTAAPGRGLRARGPAWAASAARARGRGRACSGASSMWKTRSSPRNTTGSTRVAGSMPRSTNQPKACWAMMLR